MSDRLSPINPQTMRNCKKTHCTVTFDLDLRWEESALEPKKSEIQGFFLNWEFLGVRGKSFFPKDFGSGVNYQKSLL